MAGYREMFFTHWPYRKDDGALSYLQQEEFALAAFARLCEAVQHDPRLVYALVAVETGETNQPHIQGVACFEVPLMYSHLKKLFDDTGLHCEVLKGSVQDNLDYFNREGAHKDKPGKGLAPVFQWGTPPRKGAGRPAWSKNDSSYGDLIRGLRLGKTDEELMELFPLVYVRYFHNILRLRELIQNQNLYVKESE